MTGWRSLQVASRKSAYPDNTFDAVWSQDAILHSGDRTQVIEEVARDA